MTGGTVFTKIQVKAVIFFLKSQLIHSCNQLVIVIFTLASADNLANSRNQTVYSSNGLAVWVHLHVECLDLLWIISNEYWFLEDLFGQVTLMLSLQVAAPGYLVVELVIVLH